VVWYGKNIAYGIPGNEADLPQGPKIGRRVCFFYESNH